MIESVEVVISGDNPVLVARLAAHCSAFAGATWEEECAHQIVRLTFTPGPGRVVTWRVTVPDVITCPERVITDVYSQALPLLWAELGRLGGLWFSEYAKAYFYRYHAAYIRTKRAGRKLQIPLEGME